MTIITHRTEITVVGSGSGLHFHLPIVADPIPIVAWFHHMSEYGCIFFRFPMGALVWDLVYISHTIFTDFVQRWGRHDSKKVRKSVEK